MDNDRQVELDNVQHHNEIQPTRPKNPHLDAIRGQEIPIILQNGQELSGAYDNRPHPKPSDDGDLATEASRMTIWDRGESLFFDAYPPRLRHCAHAQRAQGAIHTRDSTPGESAAVAALQVIPAQGHMVLPARVC